MFEISQPQTLDDILSAIEAVLAGERDPVANAANIAAVLFGGLERINWAGFYFLKQNELVLGPFQGKVACTRIALGRGVCGTAARSGETVVVPDVHAFPGHIACDAASRSEIVVPLMWEGRVMGVLDIDSPMEGRFGVEERVLCEAVVAAFVRESVF